MKKDSKICQKQHKKNKIFKKKGFTHESFTSEVFSVGETGGQT